MCCIIGSYQPFALSLPEIYPVALHTLLGLSPNTEYPKAAHFGFIVGISFIGGSITASLLETNIREKESEKDL